MPAARRSRYMFIALEASCALLAVGLGWLLGVDLWKRVDWSPRVLALGTFGAVPILIVAAGVARSNWTPIRRLMRLVDELIVPFFSGWSVWEMALVSAAAGVGEELLFRGVLQSFVEERLGIAAAITIASVVFGLAHYLTTAYAALALMIGAYLGWLFLATGNLAVPMVTHGVYDFLALVWLTRFSKALRVEPGLRGELGPENEKGVPTPCGESGRHS